MCGITGIIEAGRSKKCTNSVIKHITNKIKHRGPNSEGFWISSDCEVSLGHRRLSILDLSAAGNQPMHSSDDRYVIVFNGEIYNFEDLRSEILKEKSVNFRGHSDTEILLEGISLWGVEATLGVANGMFAFGLWDKKLQVLTLARDRFGKKPLYFGWTSDYFVFSSELKPIMSVPGFDNGLSQTALGHFFKYKNIPTPLSVFEGIYKLPAGTVVEFGKNEVTERLEFSDITEKARPFWKLENSFQKNGRKSDFKEAKHFFLELLRDSVDKRMISDVPLGAFLSGGVDSSLVVSIMQELSTQPVKTFTIGFDDKEFDEAAAARSVAETLGTDHTEHYFSENDAYSIIPELSSIYDEPFADASQIPTILVSRLAKKKVTVVLSGDGGDELMAGYSRHLFADKIWSASKKIPSGLKNLVSVKELVKYESIIQAMYDKACHVGLLSKNHRQFGNKVTKAVSALSVKDEKTLYRQLLSNKLREEKLFSNLIGSEIYSSSQFDFAELPSNLSVAEKMMFWDVKNYMMDDVLVKVDRATMNSSLEARCPLLDSRLFDYAWSLPFEYLMTPQGGGKRILKSILIDYVPEHILHQPKSGFRLPLGKWLTGPLREWCESLLYSNNPGYSYVNKEYVTSIWEKQLKKQGNWEDELWTILMFQSWISELNRI